MNRREDRQMPSFRPGQLSVRRQRIERWAYKDRNISGNDKAMRTSALLGTKSESSFIQADRRLNMDLYQIGQEREKLLERYNFDQKLFANKQALRHKENEDFQSTLNYVRKCCKYAEIDHEKSGEFVNSTLLSHGDRPVKTHRAHSLAPIASTIKERPRSPIPLRMNTKGSSQSAHVSSRSRSIATDQRVKSANEIRPINSAPARTSIYCRKESKKSKRPSTRIYASKQSLQQFRRYPERFLSPSNRYLPLLRRQAAENRLQSKKQAMQAVARISEGSQITFEDVKSFLSEENDAEKSSHLPGWDNHNRRNIRVPGEINSSDSTSARAFAITRLRDREYSHLQELIRTNSMRHILEPFTSVKPSVHPPRNLSKIIDSNESLRCPANSLKPAVKIEKNLSKFSILIF